MKEMTFLERLAESILEGSFNRIFKPKLQPVQVAKALVRELEQSQIVGAEGPLAPNIFVAYLHPDDLAGLSGFLGSLERDLANYLAAIAERRGYRLLCHPVVRLVDGGSTVKPGRVKVESSLDDSYPSQGPYAEEVPEGGWEGTFEMPVVMPEPPTQAKNETAVLIDDAGQAIILSENETRIGRAIENDIVLESADVSRFHAKIVKEGDNFVLIDQGSTNGSFVNGQKVTRQILSEHDKLSFGAASFTLRLSKA